MTDLVRLLHFKFIIRNSADIPRKVLGMRWEKKFEPRGDDKKDNKPLPVEDMRSVRIAGAGYKMTPNILPKLHVLILT